MMTAPGFMIQLYAAVKIRKEFDPELRESSCVEPEVKSRLVTRLSISSITHILKVLCVKRLMAHIKL